jgi:hypothetical protein
MLEGMDGLKFGDRVHAHIIEPSWINKESAVPSMQQTERKNEPSRRDRRKEQFDQMNDAEVREFIFNESEKLREVIDLIQQHHDHYDKRHVQPIAKRHGGTCAVCGKTRDKYGTRLSYLSQSCSLSCNLRRKNFDLFKRHDATHRDLILFNDVVPKQTTRELPANVEMNHMVNSSYGYLGARSSHFSTQHAPAISLLGTYLTKPVSHMRKLTATDLK